MSFRWRAVLAALLLIAWPALALYAALGMKEALRERDAARAQLRVCNSQLDRWEGPP